MLTDLTTINLSDLDGAKLVVSSSEGSNGSNQSTLSGKKRMFGKEETEGETTLTLDEKGSRRAKKFRVEWMSEVYFKDWLRPHPTDETYCICIACDIRLRCGKSELEKHASGLKHCKRMDVLKENPGSARVSILTESTPGQGVERMLCEENGTFYVAAGADHIERLDDTFDTSAVNCESTTISLTENALEKALLKLDKYLEGKAEIDKKTLQMKEIEHHRRMQVMNKELELRSLEVLVKQRELQKLNNALTSQGSSKEHSLDKVNLIVQ